MTAPVEHPHPRGAFGFNGSAGGGDVLNDVFLLLRQRVANQAGLVGAVAPEDGQAAFAVLHPRFNAAKLTHRAHLLAHLVEHRGPKGRGFAVEQLHFNEHRDALGLGEVQHRHRTRMGGHLLVGVFNGGLKAHFGQVQAHRVLLVRRQVGHDGVAVRVHRRAWEVGNLNALPVFHVHQGHGVAHHGAEGHAAFVNNQTARGREGRLRVARARARRGAELREWRSEGAVHHRAGSGAAA